MLFYFFFSFDSSHLLYPRTTTTTTSTTTTLSSRPLQVLSNSIVSYIIITRIRGHIAGPPPPSRSRYVPSCLPGGEEFSSFFPRRLARVELDLPALLGALSAVLILFFFALFASSRWTESKFHDGGNRISRTNSRLFINNNTINSRIRG